MAYWTHYWTNDTVDDETYSGQDALVHTADKMLFTLSQTSRDMSI